LNLDCADICTATGHILSRRTGSNLATVKAVLEACRIACAECAAECEKHADMHDHCRICAEACRRCGPACSDLLAVIGLATISSSPKDQSKHTSPTGPLALWPLLRTGRPSLVRGDRCSHLLGCGLVGS